MELPYNAPVHAYKWGTCWEIRDKQNRCILRLQVLKGDLDYRRRMDILIEQMAKLMSGLAWVENGENGYKLLDFGSSDGMTTTIEKRAERPTVKAPLPHANIPPIPTFIRIPEPEPLEPIAIIEEDDSAPRIGGLKPKELLERQEKRGRGRPRKV